MEESVILGELCGSRKAEFSKNRKGEIIEFYEKKLGNMKGGG